MKLKLNALAAAALVALAAGGAQAAINLPGSTSAGNSSLLFVAVDSNNNDSIAFTADLGLNMSDMLTGSSRYAFGTTTTWNFLNNTSTDASVTGNSWSTAFNTFASTLTGSYRWGVIAGDSIQGTGTTLTATNVIAGRGMLATGNVTQAQMLAANSSGPTGTALGNIGNFYAATNTLGNVNSPGINNGAGTATAGTGYGAMSGTFGGGALTWNYLLGDGETSTFQYQRQVAANPVVFQLGANTPNLDFTSADALSAVPVTFTFDIASGNLVLAAVPEASTYAMMLAGLAAIGTIVRRRRPS